MTGFQVLGVFDSSLMLAAPGGMLTIDTASIDAAAWEFTPWPDQLGVVRTQAACLVNSQVLVLTTDITAELADQSFGVAQNVFVTTLATQGLAVLNTQAFGPRLEEPTTQCLPDRALLFQTSLGVYPPPPIQRVTPEGSTPWAGMTTGPDRASVGEGIDVGTGVFVGSTLGSTYIEQITGKTTQLSAISSTKFQVWTGESLFVLTQVSDQLMVLLPTPSWEASSEYAFPEPADEP